MPPSELSRSRDEILNYMADQMSEREVTHLERVTVDHVMGQRHEVWDVHLDDGGRWWVVTNPTNFYSQTDFKSRDVVLTFHLGLAMRLLTRHQIPVTDGAREIFEPVWRRWQQAIDALVSAEEAEQFQAVGTQLRETLVSLAHEVADPALVPDGGEHPNASDVVGWVNLFVRRMTPGKTSERVRSYALSVVKPTWDYQQHLLHTKNATRMDAEIGAAAVEHLIATVTALVLRARQQPDRCSKCDAYSMVGGICRHCGWEDPDYEAAELVRPSEAAAALSEPHVLSSDISTLITVDGVLEKITNASKTLEEPGQTP